MKNLTGIPAVFDCNILIQATANIRNSASTCFRLVEAKVVNLFVSENTLQELEEVLNRDYIKEYFKYTDKVIKEFLDKVRNVAVIVKNVPKVFSLPRDVDDEEYLNLAAEVEALYLVPRDNDLLDLMTGYDVESKQFRQKTRPLKIVEPLEFLKIVDEKVKKDMSVKPWAKDFRFNLAKVVISQIKLIETNGGVLRVGNNRVSLDSVIIDFNQGSAPEQIVYDFDTLTLSDVYVIIS